MAERQEKQGSRPRATQQVSAIGQTLHNGEYQIEAVLGQGGMGRVFLVSHATLHIPLAVKQGRADQPIPEVVIAELDRILHSDELPRRSPSQRVTENDFPTSGGIHTDRFLREALLLARLRHPSIPALYDYFFEDGYWYLVMDYIPGPTLMNYLHKEAPLPPLEALNYAMQLCDVLDYLHKQTPPVIFRDIKPSNIILAPDGRVMLVDFGIARYYKEGQLNDTTEFGSPGYAPPEQYQGEGQTDGRSDLYSLGVILHEMLSGKRPLGMSGQLDSLHYLNSNISPVLSGLVSVATRAEPMYRFQSAHSFFHALEHAYSIEERRAYERHVFAFAHTAEFTANEEETQLFAPISGTLQSAARISQNSAKMQAQTRTAMQEARRERIEQAHAETHFDAVDEHLERRASQGLTPTPMPEAPEPDEAYFDDFMPAPSQPPYSPLPAQPLRPVQQPSRPARTPLPSRPSRPVPVPGSSRVLSRVIKTGFLVALILFVVLVSLLTYGYFSHSHNSNTGASTVTPGQVQGTLGTTATTLPATTGPQSAWQTLPSLPQPEADNTAMYVQLQGQSYIYVTGGYLGHTHNPHYDRGLYRYDIATAHWEKISNNNFPRMVNNAVAQDEQHDLFFTAGYSPDLFKVSSLLYMFQPTTGQLQTITPPAQNSIGFGAAMVADQQGHLYITQGFMQAANPHTLAGTGWYRYDIATGQWHTLAPLPIGLGYAVLAPDGSGGILLFGGSTDAGQRLSTMQIYRYNIAANTWTTEPTATPEAFSGATACLNSPNQFVIIGGFDLTHNTSINQVWLLNVHTLQWTPLAPLPNGGSLLGAASCDGNNHVYLARGANNPNTPTPDFWELTIQPSGN